MVAVVSFVSTTFVFLTFVFLINVMQQDARNLLYHDDLCLFFYPFFLLFFLFSFPLSPPFPLPVCCLLCNTLFPSPGLEVANVEVEPDLQALFQRGRVISIYYQQS